MVTTLTVYSPVLVLNQNYQPLNVCTVRRAFVLVGGGKAEPISNGRGHVRSVTQSYPAPSVIRLVYMVKRPVMHRRLSRQAVFYRDGFTCQYCGKQTKQLTLDHIVPRSRKGAHVWENVVSACIPCNHTKAGLTPVEAKMQLRNKPAAPRPNPYYMFHHRQILEEWRPFMPWLD
jgi:5-methylcytosine-specific restriction endonuclease McrA